ncbi:hypothetical protein SAMN05444158_6910 [Bradyrhizobium canariense]|uniref:Uncharacterized protein n=1 Tax=Bradyrhizobium canariense TaxID=255045 RepID=A0A1H2B8E7_9BRAD|nr:hypothetical protein SAMN05444158_6910 [Bradyrhizobium canariense]
MAASWAVDLHLASRVLMLASHVSGAPEIATSWKLLLLMEVTAGAGLRSNAMGTHPRWGQLRVANVMLFDRRRVRN